MLEPMWSQFVTSSDDPSVIRSQIATASKRNVRELEAVLRKEADIGLFVSRSDFAADAEREIRSSTKHIKTMDLDQITTLAGHTMDGL